MPEPPTSPVILGAVRSPLGAVHGALSELHPSDLLATVLDALAQRAGFDPASVAEVVCGCAEPVGGQGGDIARGAALAAAWPDHVGGTTVERGATSGLAALATARAVVASGAADLVVAAAIDHPSVVPAGAAAMGRHPYGRPWGAVSERRTLVPAGIAAEQLGVARDEQDDWAAASSTRAHSAWKDGRFVAEVVPVGDLAADEVWRQGVPADRDALGALPPAFDPEGTVTSGNSAKPADAAVAIAVANRRWAAANGYAARAGLDVVALTAGAPDDLASPAAGAARVALGDGPVADAVELPESTAALAVRLCHDLGLDPATVNRWGGALTLGDPIGASDLRAVVTLLRQLEHDDLARGLVVAGGLGAGAAAVLTRP